MTSYLCSILTFYLGCMFSEIMRFYCKPDMTSSWFFRQGALHAISHDGFWMGIRFFHLSEKLLNLIFSIGHTSEFNSALPINIATTNESQAARQDLAVLMPPGLLQQSSDWYRRRCTEEIAVRPKRRCSFNHQHSEIWPHHTGVAWSALASGSPANCLQNRHAGLQVSA